MTRITISADCGNAPKAQLIKDFNIAFAKGNIDAILSYFADDIYWETVGRKSWSGKIEVTAVLKSMTEVQASELIIDNILSHGKQCAANGVLKYGDGSVIGFCDIYTFSSHDSRAKIKSLISYAIDMKDNN